MSEVSVKLSADASGLSAGLQKAADSVNEFKETASERFNEVGGELTKMFAAGAVIEGLKSVGEEMERIQKLSIRFGETAETMQRVSEAAKLNGTDLETVAKAMTKVNSNAIDAEKGSSILSDAFSTLGINTKDFIDLPLEEKLSRLAESYEQGGTNAAKMDAVMKVLGKSGAELIPMFAQGGQALREEFANATVASNESVNAIAEANERLEHSFDTLKVWGAEALGWIAQRAEALGYGLAAVTAYVENLPRGFRAAKEAYNEVLQAAADLQVQQDEAQEKQTERARNSGTGEQIEATQQKAGKEEELQKLRDENNQKLWEAHERSISLAEREYEIRSALAKLEGEIAAAKAHKDEAGELKAENAKLDLQKELEENTGKQKAEKEKNARELEKLETKAAKESAKAAADAKKDELQKAEKSLEELEKKGRSHFSVDSLRAVGGGIAGVNYNAAGKAEDLQRQAINLQKQAVEELKNVVRKLDDKTRLFDNDGSFTLS